MAENILKNAQAATVKRVEYIDIARTIAAFIIVIGHTSSDLIHCGINHYFLCLNAAVYFYFFLAGSFVKSSSAKYLFSRILILLIPFIIWEIIAILLKGDIATICATKAGLASFLKRELFYYPYNNPLWFLRELIFLTCMYPLFRRFRKYAVIFSSVIFSAILILCLVGNIHYAVLIIGFICGLPFFYLGVYMQGIGLERVTKWLNSKVWSILLLYGAVCVFLGISLSLGYVTFNRTGSLMCCPILLCLGILMLLSIGIVIDRYSPLLKRVALFIAPASYFIFLSHIPFLLLVRDLMAVYIEQPLNGLSAVIAQILVTVLCFAVSSCFVFYLRKYAPALLPFIAGIRK